ncbi:MAG: ABC-type dipeptide/oligopeptide/nickel transport system, permease component [Acidimicrobiales bacterium]|nr:ABC-type dipeptide/oligopeptide/nickel transport system, permease component [Acidimicrobiales bacterium]
MPVIVRKLLQLVVVFAVVTLFTVILISLIPGKPEQLIIPFGRDSQRAALRHDIGLDKPIPVQWLKWVNRFIHGDMGNFYQNSGTRKVWPEIRSALPVSLLLLLYTQIVSLVIAVPLGVIAAYRAGKWPDKVINGLGSGMLALPGFAAALLLSTYLGVKLGWVPAQGYTKITDDPALHFKRMVIPVVALSLGQISVYMRLLRTDMVATLQEDFILMARSKGISDRRVLWRHALRPSSLTLLTVAGLNVGSFIGSAVVVETILNIPGLGYQLALAIGSRQYVALQSLVAIIAVGFVLINFVIDFLYSVLDPRIRERAT